MPLNEQEWLGEGENRDRSVDVQDVVPSLECLMRRNPARQAFSGGSSNYPPRPMAAPPLSVVDNSSFAPTRLTTPLDLEFTRLY
jgi:hypothetical protein